MEKDNKKTILVVGDDPEIVALLKPRIETAREGFRFLYASNENEGFEIALREKPDLIILDLIIPETYGCKLCSMLKTDDCSDHIPIIMLTASAEEGERRNDASVKADGYVMKPVEWGSLYVEIQRLIR